MPEDSEPLSTTVSETTTVDTGVDKETTASLNAQFEDFWAQEDKKTDGAPEAPGAAQETKDEKPEPRAKPKAEPAPKAETTRPSEESKGETDYTDDEIDRLALTIVADLIRIWQECPCNVF